MDVRDEPELEPENIFKPTILLPLIEMLEVYVSGDRMLSPDEFCVKLFTEGKTTKRDSASLKSCQTRHAEIKIQKYIQVPQSSLQIIIADLFFSIMRLERFLLIIGNEYYNFRKSRAAPNDLWRVIVLVYLLAYRISNSTVRDAIDCMMFFDISKTLKLVSYLLTPERPNDFYVAGCGVFDHDFVQENIFHPFVKAVEHLEQVQAKLKEYKRKKITVKRSTIPVTMNVLNHLEKYPPVPRNTREKLTRRRALPIPKAIYTQPKEHVELSTRRAENRLRASRLLEDANAKAPNCYNRRNNSAVVRRREKTEEEELQKSLEKRPAKPTPTFKSVITKKNATMVLREGARIANEEMKEIRKLKSLVQGAANPLDTIKFEERMRKRTEEERIRKMEEKHLAGLLTREDALIAKHDLLSEIKGRASRVRKERKELNERLEKWRKEQSRKMRVTVEKYHDWERSTRDACLFVMNEKRQMAVEVAEESRQLKQKLHEQKEEDLRRKVRLIREIRRLQSLQRLRSKGSSDPTESNGSGPVHEMSLAELEEKFVPTRTQLQEELRRKKEMVQQRRQKQKDLIECTQKTIDEYRRANERNGSSCRRFTRFEGRDSLDTPADIRDLRRKLEEKRNVRLRMSESLVPQVCFDETAGVSLTMR